MSSPCVCTRLRRAARAANTLYDAALAPAGLTTPQFALLRTLARTGACSLTAFGAATGHDRTTLNRTVGALEREGLVQSCAGDDKRRRMVSLTDAGRAAIDRASPLWERAQAEMARQVDTETLFALLDRVESAVRA
ncbi:MarR family winged helix-turn-helix transcriptional regulator [Sphingosinicella microcystinivorans]|uniref:MarR family winged helix-turn-helix transcriptional regulator n=1 Tax=Sphingosinicella microcystinivorans TaxID=335406 RepID=UPI0022F3B807|nr:MarR family winged helix-turn-helix transcriptional regulator [Sphingosinicella microcystinivorans]WBX82357.1 MarR family winged helix-turn-helix transcriptional regulator [Sphingosinicella microcystinivorans]